MVSYSTIASDSSSACDDIVFFREDGGPMNAQGVWDEKVSWHVEEDCVLPYRKSFFSGRAGPENQSQFLSP